MKAQRKTTPANRKGRRAAPKLAVSDAIKTELAPISGPVIVAGTDAPEPAPGIAEPVKAGLPVVVEIYKPDVSIAVEAMAAASERINRRRPFMDWDFLQVPAVAFGALVLKLAVLALI